MLCLAFAAPQAVEAGGGQPGQDQTPARASTLTLRLNLAPVAVYTPDLAANLEYKCRTVVDSDDGFTGKYNRAEQSAMALMDGLSLKPANPYNVSPK